MSRTQTIADLLQARRIDWRRIEALGGSPSKIYAEAVGAGDTRLARLASAAGRRSALRAHKAGRLDEWLNT